MRRVHRPAQAGQAWMAARRLARVLGSWVLLASMALPAVAQEVLGFTWDGTAGAPVSGATVVVRDLAGQEVGHPGAISDAAGRFSVSLEGISLPVVLVASKSGFTSSAPFFVEEASGAEPFETLLELQRLDPGGGVIRVREGVRGDDDAAQVIGWVTDRDTGRPVTAAEVRVMGTSLAALSDVNGMFILNGLPPGETTLGITHISYAPEGSIFRASPGASYEIRVSMAAEAIALEGVEVQVRSQTWYRQMDGMRLRMQQGLRGDFLTRSDFDARGNPPVGEAIRGLAGVQVFQRGPFSFDVRFRLCEYQPVLFIDGVQVNQPELQQPLDELQLINGMDVEAVEVYRGAASVPPEFAGPDAMCGAIVVWTRR